MKEPAMPCLSEAHFSGIELEDKTGQDGNLQLRTDLLSPPGGWTTDTGSLTGAPVCYALGTDSQQQVEDAKQWSFSHQTFYELNTIAPPLHKLIFLRVGMQWKNTIPLHLEGDNLYITFRDNLATRGDCQAAVPCIALESVALDSFSLDVTLRLPGRYSMALVTNQQGNDWRVYESEWVVVP
jgi:hypothetical protein